MFRAPSLSSWPCVLCRGRASPRSVAAARSSPFVRSASRVAGQHRQRRPSRLVLSDKVAEHHNPRHKKKRAATPPAALNRRHANVLPPARTTARVAAQPRAGTVKPKPVFKQMKMAQSLADVSRTARTSASSEIQNNEDSFDDFNLLQSIREAVSADVLSDLDTIRPTPVQKLVIPALLGRRARKAIRTKNAIDSYLIAAETGSGKTLAYVLPILHHLKLEEEEEEEEARRLAKEEQAKVTTTGKDDEFELEIPTVNGGEDERVGRPRAVILVPTAELVNQVGAMVKALSHRVKFRAALISREFSAVVLRKRLFQSLVDVVIATPQLLGSMTERSVQSLSKVSHIVVDEADSLFDRSFSAITSTIIARSTNLRKLVLCSATIPRSLDQRLRSTYPDITRLVTPNLHAVPRRVQLTVTDVDAEPYRGNRKLACADTLYNIARDGSEEGYVKKVIVFVNEREAAAEVAEYLRSKGLDAVEFERDSTSRSTSGLLAEFTGPKEQAEPKTGGKQRLKVLVTTDIASRGVDTKTVKNVVLYDVPFSTVDFIHRLGRTGRMGRRGRAVVLVDKHTNKGWIKDIKRSMHMGGPLL